MFDLDGTLLDRDRSLLAFAKNQYQRFNQQLASIEENAFVERLIALDQHGSVWKDQVYQQLLRAFGIKDLHWETLLNDYIRHFCDHSLPFPKMVKTLQTLSNRGFYLGIITNGQYPFQFNNIQSLGIESRMSVILVSAKEGIRKPDSHIFHQAARRLGLKPSDCVFVGDHPEKDVAAAKQAGFRAIWKRNDIYHQPSVYDGMITNLDELNDMNFKEISFKEDR